MNCKNCNNTWDYSGLSSKTAYCPKCGTLNYIERQAKEIHHKMGIPY